MAADFRVSDRPCSGTLDGVTGIKNRPERFPRRPRARFELWQLPAQSRSHERGPIGSAG